MAKASEIEKRVEELLTPVAAEHGVRVYDVEFVKEGPDYTLNCYIDKDGGVNIGDCEAVSRHLSDILDEKDPVNVPYTLVVSSPGLGRTLTRNRHFAASIGEKVEGTLFRKDETLGGKTFEGVLKAFDAGTVTLETDGGELTLDRRNISRISLVVEF